MTAPASVNTDGTFLDQNHLIPVRLEGVHLVPALRDLLPSTRPRIRLRLQIHLTHLQTLLIHLTTEGPEDREGFPDHQVQEGYPDQEDRKDLKGYQADEEVMDPQDLQDLQVPLVPQGHPEVQDPDTKGKTMNDRVNLGPLKDHTSRRKSVRQTSHPSTALLSPSTYGWRKATHSTLTAIRRGLLRL